MDSARRALPRRDRAARVADECVRECREHGTVRAVPPLLLRCEMAAVEDGNGGTAGHTPLTGRRLVTPPNSSASHPPHVTPPHPFQLRHERDLLHDTAHRCYTKRATAQVRAFPARSGACMHAAHGCRVSRAHAATQSISSSPRCQPMLSSGCLNARTKMADDGRPHAASIPCAHSSSTQRPRQPRIVEHRRQPHQPKTRASRTRIGAAGQPGMHG